MITFTLEAGVRFQIGNIIKVFFVIIDLETVSLMSDILMIVDLEPVPLFRDIPMIVDLETVSLLRDISISSPVSFKQPPKVSTLRFPGKC